MRYSKSFHITIGHLRSFVDFNLKSDDKRNRLRIQKKTFCFECHLLKKKIKYIIYVITRLGLLISIFNYINVEVAVSKAK